MSGRYNCAIGRFAMTGTRVSGSGIIWLMFVHHGHGSAKKQWDKQTITSPHDGIYRQGVTSNLCRLYFIFDFVAIKNQPQKLEACLLLRKQSVKGLQRSLGNNSHSH